MAIVCILTINVMWIHNIFLGLFSIAEVILVYVSQYFIRAIQHNQNINILGYKSNKISSQKYNVTVLNFKVIEVFCSIKHRFMDDHRCDESTLLKTK